MFPNFLIEGVSATQFLSSVRLLVGGFCYVTLCYRMFLLQNFLLRNCLMEDASATYPLS